MKTKNTLLFIILLFTLVISIFLAITIGSVPISFKEVIAVLMGGDTSSTTYVLITTIRIPRVMGAMFAGAGLAGAGVILQGVMNNALASPNTIGVNAGAGFAVMLAMILLPKNMAAISTFAFGGALITTLLIFGLAYFADRSRVTIILAGITVSSFLSAGMNMMKLVDENISINLMSFLIGSLSGVSMARIAVPIILISTSIIMVCILANALNILGLGDDIAQSLGMRVSGNRFVLLVFSSIMAGAVVSYAGMLGFVGLIVPHICRKMMGNDARILLPGSALTGASFVIICDLFGRTLFSPYEIPVGIIMSLIGGPFFIYLLMRKKGGKRVSA